MYHFSFKKRPVKVSLLACLEWKNLADIELQPKDRQGNYHLLCRAEFGAVYLAERVYIVGGIVGEQNIRDGLPCSDDFLCLHLSMLHLSL